MYRYRYSTWLLTGLLLSQIVSAQYDTIWTRVYSGNNYDRLVDIAACSDNGFILAGYTNSFGTAENSGWLVRIDSIGNTLWTQTYGDQGYNYLEAVQETHDGGFVLTGLTGYSGPGDNYDLWLIRTDEYGDTLWTRRHGGANNDSGDEIICANDSTYIIGGNTDSFGSGASDAWLLAVNANGDTLWTRTFGGSRIESLDDLDLTPDNGFVFTGFSSSFGNQTNAAWVVRTDSIGNEIWSSHVSGDHRDRAYAVHPMSDGTYVVVGETASFGAVLSDTWLLKFSDTGDTLWTRIIGGNWYDWASDVVETPDSNIFIVGKTSFFGFPPDAWAAQFDRNGELQSAVIFDIDLFGTFIEVEPHPGGGYVIVGIGDPNADTGPDATALRLVPIDNSPPTQFHLKLPPEDTVIVHAVGCDSIVFVWMPSIDPEGDSLLYLFEANSGTHSLFSNYTTSDTTISLSAELAVLAKSTSENPIKVEWRITAWDSKGNFAEAFEIARSFYLVLDFYNELDEIHPEPSGFKLHPAYPNPFNPVTMLKFDLLQAADLTLTVYDLLGREVYRLFNGYVTAGSHELVWHGQDHGGREVASGIYIANLKTAQYSRSVKMVLLR